jgi:hypothetical protein
MGPDERHDLIMDIYNEIGNKVEIKASPIYSCFGKPGMDAEHGLQGGATCNGLRYITPCFGTGRRQTTALLTNLRAGIRAKGLNVDDFIYDTSVDDFLDMPEGCHITYYYHCNGHDVTDIDPETGEEVKIGTYWHRGGGDVVESFQRNGDSFYPSALPGEGDIVFKDAKGNEHIYHSVQCDNYTIDEELPSCMEPYHNIYVCFGHVDAIAYITRADYVSVINRNWKPKDDELKSYNKYIKDFTWTDENKALVEQYVKADWYTLYGIITE